MTKKHIATSDIAPKKNTKTPPYDYPEVLAAPAKASAWEGSPFNAFQKPEEKK